MRSIIGLFFILSLFFGVKESEIAIIAYPEIELRPISDSLFNNELRIEFSSHIEKQGILHYVISDKLLYFNEAEDIISGKSNELLTASLIQLGSYKNKHFTRILKNSDKYYIYSIFKTSDNEQSKIKVDSVLNVDTNSPKLLSNKCTPSHLQKTGLKLNVQLCFNEGIVLTENSEIHIQVGYKSNSKHYLIKREGLSLNGNIVSIKDENLTFDYDQYVIISAKEGAFMDLSGNNSEEIKGLVGSNFLDADYYFLSYTENEIENLIE